jgi:hypothetical protein
MAVLPSPADGARVSAVRVDFGVMTQEQRQTLQQSLRGSAGPEPVIPFAQPGARNRVRDRQRQGRRRALGHKRRQLDHDSRRWFRPRQRTRRCRRSRSTSTRAGR